MATRVDLRIGELVLEGVSPSDRARVIAALERELASQVAAGQIPRRSQATIVGERPASESPAELGRGVARSIVGPGVKGGRR